MLHETAQVRLSPRGFQRCAKLPACRLCGTNTLSAFQGFVISHVSPRARALRYIPAPLRGYALTARLICSRMARASAPGFAASVMGRPTTM